MTAKQYPLVSLNKKQGSVLQRTILILKDWRFSCGLTKSISVELLKLSRPEGYKHLLKAYRISTRGGL